MNSTMEALTYEVPLVVIPQIEEQMITARNVTEMGLGLKLERPTLTTSLLAEAVAHVHNSQAIAAKVASMAQAIKEAGGPKAVLTLVDRIVEVEGGTAFVVSQETSSESKVTSTTNSMGR
jgi:UDP:flavonoid glycosyltransferase YjiC (YdhE family)